MSTVYVGNLPGDVRESEVDDLFYKYGKVASIDIKPGQAGGMPAYCFVEFSHPDDAYDAVKAMDGKDVWGKRLRVELSRGGRRGGADGGGSGRYDGRGGRASRPGGGYRDRYDNRGCGAHGASGSRRTGHRVLVTGLPPTCSWQDLKDHMRKGGEVTFAQVMKDNSGLMRGGLVGLVDYGTAEDLRNAIRKLDDSEFRNPFDKCYIRVKEDMRGSSAHGRERSTSRSSSRSSSRGARRSSGGGRSPSRSRSKSPMRRPNTSPHPGSPAQQRHSSDM